MTPLASKKSLLHTINSYSRSTVIVIGDIMLDHFIRGNVSRISPEAPVPVVSISAESLRLGGAANVVHNIHALGGTVFASGLVGNDEMGKKIVRQFKSLDLDTKGLVVTTKRPTTVKTRIIAHNQQVVRFDREVVSPLTSRHLEKIVSYLKKCLPAVDVIIISDYGKSVVSRKLIEETVNLSTEHNIPVLVDPKVRNIDRYRGVSIITPNQKEASETTGIDILTNDDARKAAQVLRERVQCESVLITRGDQGMTLLERDDMCTHIPTLATEVYDVTGAGDTVIGALALSLASGASLKASALLANLAAGIVVRKLGTAAATLAELKKSIQKENNFIGN
jgi:D-beta-D-heptose 7-phosphate kinase/D-beta-D-heptose 1-phosphate adenosyltransferase